MIFLFPGTAHTAGLCVTIPGMTPPHAKFRNLAGDLEFSPPGLQVRSGGFEPLRFVPRPRKLELVVSAAERVRGRE